MTTVVIHIKNPESIDEATNILLNIMGGLTYEELSDKEKETLRLAGYEP